MDAIEIIDGGPGWVVVNKPSDLSVHNQPGRDLISRLARQIKGDGRLAERLSYGSGSTVGPVHRLDRETSGVMLLSLNPDTSRWFSRQFEQRHVEKHYLALVHGSFSEIETVWDRSLSPEAGGRQDPEGKGKTVPCATRIRVIDQGPHYALIECDLLTGRKHQIRRHAKLAGHPVLGDERYGSKRAVEFVRNRCQFTRLALHSHALEVSVPITNETKRFTAPIPPEFLEMMERDKAGS